ncbi:molybdopterin dinucleotide binding domain-containing protein [Pedococcus sp. NPDC057267]|uniref:molybdopterin dinucleotide binding domain-containing protein n=1 Tax=Pedococcus sp. NPDC057267 TaxID=3346077 RepID=UPI00362F4136
MSELDLLEAPPGHLVLQTMRSHDQFNTTIYGLSDRYRGIEGGLHAILLNYRDMEALNLSDGDHADIVAHWPGDNVDRRVQNFRVAEYETPRGSVAAYYPETKPLVPLGSVAKDSNTPTSKSVVVRLERSEGGRTPHESPPWPMDPTMRPDLTDVRRRLPIP